MSTDAYPNRSPPHQQQDPSQIARLVSELESHSSRGKSKSGFSVKSATFNLPDGRTVQSWRMQDWDYKKDGLPTYARGLFTWINPITRYNEIVIRGYDKFFNHGEVPNTEWENVQRNTRGPYELSVKENGCIIFIGGLDDETLLVCSKHSTGARGDSEKSHAIAGERWLDKHLKSVGKTKADLAKELRRLNVTAVAELCDDQFEEHVLAYAPDAAGLYLHGLNLNLSEFATHPHYSVDEFARAWGMKVVTHVVMDDITKVKAFLDECANTGSFGGRDTEGFVIRCQATDNKGREWHDWFFKYKFEEPYLMYRQWRECTKAVIAGKPPRYKKHKKITEEYLLFARRRLASDSNLGKEYNQNHGIIALRDDFLAHKGVTGADVIKNEIDSGELTEVTNDVFLVPIATIGCGKTTLGVALCKLFDWAQFQNDNVQGKGNRANRFVTQCAMLLAERPVVFADRNNHQKRERAQFIDDVTKIVPRATIVALHWVHDRNNIERIRQSMRERVLSRGDNHQTIHADTKGRQEVIGIMDGFLGRFQPADPSASPDADFDLIIGLNPLVSTRDNLEIVISKLNEEYPKLFPETMPDAQALDEAIAYAMNVYKPDVKHDLGSTFSKKQQSKQMASINKQQSREASPAAAADKKGKRRPKLEYFSVRLSTPRILAVLEAIFNGMAPERAKMYHHLSQSRRLQNEFHVTLIHRAQETRHAGIWKNMTSLHEQKTKERPDVVEPTLGEVGVQLERILWDSRIMCFIVRLVPGAKPGGHFESVNSIAHITCGTASQDVKPKESNDLLERWLEGGPRAHGIDEEKVKGTVVLDGVVKGVMQKF